MNPFTNMKVVGTPELPARYSKLTPNSRRRVREAYIGEQQGLCWHCGMPLNGPVPAAVAELPIEEQLFPKNFFDYPIHLHHSHETSMTVGVVHAYCNAVLWQYLGE